MQSRFPALVATQALKRSFLNVRGALQVPKTQNPKALALFISAILRAPQFAPDNSRELLDQLCERLEALRSPGASYWCWGYSFPWQGRSLLVPRWTPNLVCTSFAATAYLDLYSAFRDERHLEVATSAAEYLLRELFWTDGDAAGFSYPLPALQNMIYNANLLGAALLARIWKYTREERFLDVALRVARHSVKMQRPDGSWFYGKAPTQAWIDNFHTGYNLGALRSLSDDIGSDEFDSCISRGFDFYRTHFFREDGAPRYFHDRTYPIDIHCVAQSIITLSTFSSLDSTSADLADLVFRWAMNYMCDDEGFFYYRVLRSVTIRISYMRWSQAWMLRALAELVSKSAPQSGLDCTERLTGNLRQC